MPSEATIIVLVGGFLAGYLVFSKLLGRMGQSVRDNSVNRSVVSREERVTMPVSPRHGMNWQDVLSVDEDSSIEQIRTAYQRLITAYHPDEIACFSRENQRWAECKRREIDFAYEAALRFRRLKGDSWRGD